VGFRTATLDYVRAPRVSGQTKFSGWRLWNLALEGITGFSTVPLLARADLPFGASLLAVLEAP
jgi:hypothetical protein